MIRFQAHVAAKELLREPLQKESRHETVQIAFVRKNNFWSGQIVHRRKNYPTVRDMARGDFVGLRLCWGGGPAAALSPR